MRTFAVVGLFVLLASGAVLAGEGRIEIGPTSDFPIVINQPGSYLLTTDLSTSSAVGAIRIESSDVILDLGGHFIRGGGTTGSSRGVTNMGSAGGIVVRNGGISNFAVCLALNGTVQSRNAIEHVNVSACDQGIVATATAVVHSGASGCTGVGIYLENGSVSSSDAMYSAYGIQLSGSSCDACTANHNATGFSLQNSSCHGCRANANSTDGFDISPGGNLLTASSAHANLIANVTGSCSAAGNACFNSLLP